MGGATNNKGVIISTEKLKKFSVDKENKIVQVGTGVTLKELAEELKKYNLWYPVDSTEQTATIGGNFATNASGTRSFRFGCIRDFVRKASLILVTGEKINLKRKQIVSNNLTFDFEIDNKKIKFDILDLSQKFCFKNSAGYYMKKNMDLMDLFIGSEGTLAIVTDISLKVMDMPYDIAVFLVYFDSKEKCFEVIKELKKVEKPYKPISIEYFDKNSLNLLNSKLNTVNKRASALIFEFLIEKSEGEEKTYLFIDSFFTRYGINSKDIFIASSKYKDDFIYKARESLPQIINEYVRHKGLRKVSTDFAVHDDLFDEMIKIYDNILDKAGISYVIFGHAGDNNLHINFLPENDKEYIKTLELYEIMAGEIGKIGGTISAEHGIGKLKKRYLKYMYDNKIIDKMREIKKFFDSEMRLNAGNIFD